MTTAGGRSAQNMPKSAAGGALEPTNTPSGHSRTPRPVLGPHRAALDDIYLTGYRDGAQRVHDLHDALVRAGVADIADGLWSPEEIATRLAVAEAKVARVEALADEWEEGGNTLAAAIVRETLAGPS